MGEEFLRIPPKVGPTAVDYGDELKTDPAKLNAAPAKVKAASSSPTSRAPLLTNVGTEKNAWQQSTEVKKIIESLEGRNSEISIVLDAQQIIVKVLDATTGEVIRGVPLKDPPLGAGPKLTGLLLDATE